MNKKNLLLRKSSSQSSGQTGPGPTSTGFWNDDGEWVDTKIWTELGYNERYQRVMAYAFSEAITLPDAAQLTKDSDLVTAIESFITKIKGMKMIKHNGSRVADYSKIDWITPGTFSADFVNNPAYDNDGVYSNGTTSYVDSGNQILQVSQQNFCIFSKGVINSGQAGSFLFGASNVSPGSSGSTFINPRNTTDNFSYQAASTTQQAVGSTTDATNILCVGRTSGNHFHSINGAEKVINANTYSPIAPTSKKFFICADNGLSGANGFNTRGSSFFMLCEDLSNAEIATVHAALVSWLS
jgi:hypothetical protein